MKIGDIEIQPVIDGFIISELPSSRPLPAPDSVAWKEQHGMFRPDGMVESAVGALLVRAGNRLILVDAGSGQPFASGNYTPPALDPNDVADPFVTSLHNAGLDNDAIRGLSEATRRIQVSQGQLLVSLRQRGVDPAQVTDLVFSHLHFDHIGWASADQSPVFPNADIHCAAADLEYFLPGPNEETFVGYSFGAVPAKDRLEPVLDRIKTWESDTSLFPGIDIRLVGGHTPGSSVVVLSSQQKRAMLLGDMIHCPLELTDDDFNFMVDCDPVVAMKVREAYARELEGTDVVATAAHFPGLQFGRVLPGSGTRRWTFDVD